MIKRIKLINLLHCFLDFAVGILPYIPKHNEIEEGDLQKQTEKYEEDRIGKGKIGTVRGFVTGVGKPDKKPLNKGAYENAKKTKNE